MNTIDDFVTLLNDEIGLQVTAAEAELKLDQVPNWDSLHLLSLLSALERATGRPVSMPDVLEASSLKEIYLLAVDA